MKILYVEDNKVNLMLVERVARMDGHRVINRTTGETTIEEFDDIAPDVVLMDIQLEGVMTGLDAVKVLRERGVDVPIIAVTAYAMKGDREKALNAGCDEYIPKPIPVKMLLELLKKYGSQPKSAAKPTESDKEHSATDKPDTVDVKSSTPESEEVTESTNGQTSPEPTPAASEAANYQQQTDPNPNGKSHNTPET